ncbi:MAG TPA: hypothetical protein VN618_05795 [Solirubrobacteraceae bacterium]|nr:hypothetical protein [Solirubrobacteraceae bacterium]
MPRRQIRFARTAVAAVAGVAAALVLTLSSGSSASSIADFTGHWSLVDHVVSGPETGEDYPWSGDWTQTGSELTGTGGYTIVGSVSGSTANFKTTSGGKYVATFHLTMSADGKSLSGSAEDNEGRSFTVTATGAGKPATEEPAKTTTSIETPKPPEAPKPPSSKPPLLPHVDPSKITGRIQSISGRNVSVVREGKRYAVEKNSELQTGDVVETGTGTFAALEFSIGGRVGINRESKVTMTGEREVTDGKPSGPRATIERGTVWVKPDSKSRKEPIEIQTNGGVMGIKG